MSYRIVLMLLLGWPLLAAAAIELDVSPDPVIQNQSCQISFTVTGSVDDDPDFSALAADFEIVGTNRQTSIGWRNGRSTQTTTWVLSAIPKRSGTVTIPAIRFGAESSPARAVQVVTAPATTNTAGADIILQVEADNPSPYVQQQVIYTIRLLHRVELSSPRFSALDTSTDAIVKPLGDGRQYRHQLNGTNYEAFEQRYAIFPQTSGAMHIRPLVLTTQVISRKRSFFDPFSQSLQTRRVESEAIDLDVRPIPAGYPADATWLPARRLRLHDEWEPDVTSADVGAPIARTVFLWADGLIAGQLPEIGVEPPAGTKIYPDQPQSSDQDTATGFTAVMQQKFALIAGVPGRGRFEAITLPWWNTTTDTLEYATIDARELEFVGTPAPAAPAVPGATPTTADDTERPAAAADPAAVAPMWRYISAALALLWLVTALGWWRSSHARGAQRSPERPDVPRGARPARDLKAACSAHEPRAAAQALLAWAHATLPQAEHCRALPDVAARVSGADFAAAIRALDQHLYGRTNDDWDGTALWQTFRQEPRPAARVRAAQTAPLPDLFRLATKQ